MDYALRCCFQPNAYRVVGYGKQTARAAEKVRQGVPIAECGDKTKPGNGSVMRSAILGVLLSKVSEDTMTYCVKTMSSITHGSPACLDGAVVIARAARYAFQTRDKPFMTNDFIAYVSNHMEDNEFKQAVLELPNILDTPSNHASKMMQDFGCKFGEHVWNGISAGVRQTTLWALVAVLKHPDDYIACIASAIRGGGDVDTTAAIAGAIIGTRVGHNNIPTIWKEKLQDLGEWTYTELCDLTKKVYELYTKDKIIPLV